ncbi:hypothetical protein CUMW_213650 [Citrus unshiu]|uniref:Pectate lyase n=1 Tax=Citrus unshiu TaxID=55188 RepID=A0A2H5QBG9_CITUN|nr:hypothetical protein CUMW_213650 [Citrus unshiu]
MRSMLRSGKYWGPCQATNPVDRCWRCWKDWANYRPKLADFVPGFGHKITGGQKGPIYIVTDSSDNDLTNSKPGTLCHAVIQNGPLWIIFARDLHIKLSQELIMTSDKTIDARGADVHIAYGARIMIQHVKNVILNGLSIHYIFPASASDSYAPDKMMQVTIAYNHFGRGLIQKNAKMSIGNLPCCEQ